MPSITPSAMPVLADSTTRAVGALDEALTALAGTDGALVDIWSKANDQAWIAVRELRSDSSPTSTISTAIDGIKTGASNLEENIRTIKAGGDPWVNADLYEMNRLGAQQKFQGMKELLTGVTTDPASNDMLLG
jgi:hypothetical protein